MKPLYTIRPASILWFLDRVLGNDTVVIYLDSNTSSVGEIPFQDIVHTGMTEHSASLNGLMYVVDKRLGVRDGVFIIALS